MELFLFDSIVRGSLCCVVLNVARLILQLRWLRFSNLAFEFVISGDFVHPANLEPGY